MRCARRRSFGAQAARQCARETAGRLSGGFFVFKGAPPMWTPTDLANLKKAIATGAKSVQFGSGDNAHRTEFRTLAEMMAIKAEIERELAPRGASAISYAEHRRD
jgi:hypothetical protein